MSLIAAAVFAIAFLFSAYAILLTMAQSWSRIEAVAAMRDTPPERTIHFGQVRHTGQRVRLVVVNGLDTQPQQRTLKFGHLRAA